MASFNQSSEHHKLIRIDSISHLPDPLLCCILSFVTTKEAVVTSILSEQWQYLWTWVPILDVVDHDFYHHKDTSFEDIVSKSMLSRKTRCIRAFRMRWNNYSSDKTRVQSWICSAVPSNVAELCLRIHNMEEDIQLPPSLVSCKTLTVLKLEGRFVLNVPSSVHLPRLKVLLLWIVPQYEGDNSFRNLISACPVLHQLRIHRYVDSHSFVYEISSSTLTTLVLYNCSVKINTPALKYLDLVNSSFAEPPINQLNNLVQANVKGSCEIEMPIQWLDFKKIIYAIYNVKSLELGHPIMTCLSEHIGFFETCKFQNLIKLKVDVESFENFSGLLEKLLMNSPHLQHFTIMDKCGA